MYARLIGVVVCLLGVCAARAAESSPSVDVLIEEVSSLHADGPEPAVLREAALEGVLSWLEEEGGGEARLMDRQEFERYEAHARGERFGVGMRMLILPGYGIRVMEVFEGTPAARAGLAPGDVVVAVEGVPLRGRDAPGIRSMLEARAGRAVRFDVVSPEGVPERLRLEPESYYAPPVSVDPGDGYRLVRVHHFGEGGAGAMEEILRGTDPDTALVLDLRDTGEGLLSEAVEAAALFAGGRAILGFGRSAGGSTVALRPERRVHLWSAPVAVLVNGGTAGVAELFAGELQRGHPRAVLVGTPTAGRAHLPSHVPWGGDHVIRFVGHRLALHDRSTWEGSGLEPDVTVSPVVGTQVLPPPAPPPDLQVDAALKLVSGGR